MKINIIVNLSIEGLHYWPLAVDILPTVGYLGNLHRHIFHIECKKTAHHDDRDVEFIDFKHLVYKYLIDKYYNSDYNCCFFSSMSCEMIAKELANRFDLYYCKVMEDNENGSEVLNT